jgi:hypothetical protein
MKKKLYIKTNRTQILIENFPDPEPESIHAVDVRSRRVLQGYFAQFSW